MTHLLRCVNGHRWSDAPALDGVTVDLSSACPVCGAAGVAAREDTAQHGQTPEMTIAHHLQLPSQTDVATLPPSMGPDASGQTSQIDSAAEVAQGSATLPDGVSSYAAQDVATLPPTSSDLPSSDLTEPGDENGDTSDRTRPIAGLAVERDRTLDQTEATAPPRLTDVGRQDGGTTGKRGPAGPTKATGKYRKDAKLPDKVAGYEILGLLGRGGMGVVYKARQSGLNRLCALKMILGGGLASSDAIARFKIEAEAIAHLQHPNIVQVYEIGEDNGNPYFSLEFVDGSNLQNKIASTPQPPAETARMMIQICEGVYAAHQRGVLHRDLKPANVLLTKDNLPKITDFGLAKRLEEQDHGQTRTGAIMGTPSYMAPEQAMGRAKELGPPADIYSLGAVLYDMLTGRPPFRGETVMDTLNQVQKLEPLPPTQLVPKVPRDLQTICLKALNKEPSKRYTTAGAMADDLRRFLANEPILARPTPLWERGLKWTKRRPALATLIGVSTLAFFSVLAFGALWLDSRREAAEDRERQQTELTSLARKGELKAKENEAKQKELREDADISFDQARNAVDKMLTEVGAINLEYEPRMEQVRKKLLDEALKFNLAFLAQRGADPSVRYDAARAYENVGKINRMLAKYDESAKNYQAALDRYGELAREFAKREEYQRAVAKCTKELALVAQLQGKLAESEKGYRQAKKEFDEIAADHPEETDYQIELANLQYSLGGLCMLQQRLQEAEAYYDAALNVRTVLMAKGFDTAAAQQGLAGLQLNRGILLYLIGKKADSEKSLVAARDTLAALSKSFPEVPDYATDWAYCSINLGICYRKSGRPQLAETSLKDAVEALRKLQATFPTTPIYRQKLAHAVAELGILKGEQTQFSEARDLLSESVEILEKLRAMQPEQSSVQVQMAQTYITLGIAYVAMSKMDDALKNYSRGVEILEAMKPVAAASPDVCSELARGHENLAELQTYFKKPVEADKSWQRLLTLREELVAAFPQSAAFRTMLAMTDALFAQRFLKADNTAEGIKHAAAAVSQMQQALNVRSNDDAIREQTFSVCLLLSKANVAAKDHAAAATAASDASKLFPSKSGPNAARRESLVANQYGQCMLLVDKDQALSAADKTAKVTDYGDKALAALQQAVSFGYKDAKQLNSAPEYRLLRERPEFKELVKKMEKK